MKSALCHMTTVMIKAPVQVTHRDHSIGFLMASLLLDMIDGLCCLLGRLGNV
jgi:hypothetical protein